MESDKIIIILALVITLFAFGAKEKIIEDIYLVGQSQTKELAEIFPSIYFSPLSQQERREILSDYLVKLCSIQNRVSKSLFIKYFVDFREHIAEQQKELLENKIGGLFGDDAVSFATAQHNTVIAQPYFSTEQLLHFGSLLDEIFPAQADSDVISTIDWEDTRIVVTISPKTILLEEKPYEEFALRLCSEVFHDKPVTVHMTHPDSQDIQVFGMP